MKKPYWLQYGHLPATNKYENFREYLKMGKEAVELNTARLEKSACNNMKNTQDSRHQLLKANDGA